MFGAYLIVWALFTAMLALGAHYVNVPAFAAFVLLVVVYVLLGIGNLVGSLPDSAEEHGQGACAHGDGNEQRGRSWVENAGVRQRQDRQREPNPANASGTPLAVWA
jgi:hypothetical protein